MAEPSYVNFDLTIRHKTNEKYIAESYIPNWKLARVVFDKPFSIEEVNSFRTVLGGPARDVILPDSQRRQLSADYSLKIKSFGRRLYESIFIKDLQSGFSQIMKEAANEGAGVRIRLLLDDAPELAELPWEYIYEPGNQRYLVLSQRTPVVRFFPRSSALPAKTVKPPLNILVMLSNPPKFTQLKVEQEWILIKNALEPLVKDKKVTIDKLPNTKYPIASPSALLEQLELENKDYHIFHFIGHGDFDESTGEAGLAFEGGKDGKGEIVSINRLEYLLDHHPLRLTILNSCDGARSSKWDAYSGVAQHLINLGIPAVIAMQHKITDDAAIKFAENFYKALSRNLSLEASINFARKTLIGMNPTEWGTPVLFSQSEDGHIFDIPQPLGEQERISRIETYSNEAQVAIEKENWNLAIDKLKAIVDLEES